MKALTDIRRVKSRYGSMLALAGGLLIASSCDGVQSHDATGGETHFLTLCEPGVECGEGLACLCGVCTRSCIGSDDCGELTAAECLGTSELDLCADAAAQTLCDASCTSDADCAALSPDHACLGGRCRAGGSEAAAAGGASAAEEDGGDGGAGECESDEVDANQVLVIGDSFFGATHQITAYLEELARRAGVLAVGERYRDNSSAIANALSYSGNGIFAQYEAAAAEASVRVVIMNGGGADALLGSCETPTSDCPLLLEASTAAQDLLTRMAEDGVEHVVYAFYPNPVDLGLREKMDALRPLIEQVCGESSVPCYWLDLRPVFADRYDEYIQADGLNPTAAGSEATAAEIWTTMQENCIAQ